MQTLTVKALNGFTALSNEELEMVDGGGRFEEVCHTVVVASCGVVGGAIGSTAGPIGTASGAIAGSAFGEYIWQSVMED